MYRRYAEDPSSVSEAWREFLEDYRPRTEEAPKPEPEASPPEPEPEEPAPQPEGEPLRGAAAVIAERMEESLGVPTATSVRTIPAKLLEVNRSIVNRHLARKLGRGKVSFTHLIGWAVVKAIGDLPGMNVTYRAGPDGTPQAVRHEHVHLGLAVDVKRKDGTRTLLVPTIKRADTMDFAAFFAADQQL